MKTPRDIHKEILGEESSQDPTFVQMAGNETAI